MSDFALIGAAGFIAPRHFKAIKETGNNLVAALDKFDSVGIMDSYFPQASFFTEFERFDRHLEKLNRAGNSIDYLSICSPNYLHDSHIRFGLRHGATVICEKPLVLNPWNIDALEQLQAETGKKIYQILQLRLHPHLQALKEKVEAANPSETFDLDLTYITSRGNWYYSSWKGDIAKSGGVATNIGIHFFDMLIWIFGAVKETVVHVHTHDRAAGFIQLERARVRWFLSINEETLPAEVREKKQRTYRSIKLKGEEIEFSEGFADLHTKSYQQILDGDGFTVEEALPSINLAHRIRQQTPVGLLGDYHPFAGLGLSNHPFFLSITE
ncbi:Gfo/Idh/MocA family protein [Flavisolibacter ginsenosidimutans]|uniref:Gfo/Idh/MocA family oxidoreductase n=1 Tax=Flavisolibacter ginsenosidimutans TaxID=661481 RepID=A0A5B8UII3_9BACT|nr:Gfo/Idh/MocA family oxidoreductase [Flavisolibacter ginsenosidimutans]QEC56484.1 Gfo/Idh/MocA family oxidoreductase [Flavisolibacter ginsenosidimutans]